MAVRAGSSELSKVLRRYRGLSLEGKGPHPVVFLNGEPLRYSDGRKMVLPCSPKNPGDAAKLLVQNLRRMGVEPRRA